MRRGRPWLRVAAVRVVARFFLLGTGLLCLAGCGDYAAGRGLAARAGDWTLTEDRLAELLVLAQPFPLDTGSVFDLVRHWQGAAALALRSAAGDSLLVADALATSTWLDRREALLAADRDDRLSETVALSPAVVEDVFREGSLRLVAHVLRRVGPMTSSNERLLQQRTAERILGALVEGGSWDQAVSESEDVGSRQAAGILGLVAEGELPSTLDRAAFRLEPGQVSAVAQTSQGFHILYRPRFEDVEGLFGSLLRNRRLAEADAVAGEEERSAKGFEGVSGATGVLERIAAEPRAWLESRRPMATWEGGSMDAGVLARYLLFFPEASRAELAGADDAARRKLILELGTRELRLGDARERGLVLVPSVEDGFVRAHEAEIEYWTQVLELAGPQGSRRAALSRYMERVVSRQEEARSLSPLFEAWLLGRVDGRIRERGVLAASVKAQRMIEGAGGS